MARRRAFIGLALAIVILIFAIPQFANYGEAWATLMKFDRRWLGLLVVVAVLNLFAPALSQVAALPGLTVGQAVRSDWATSALVNTVPFGGAASVGLTWTMYRSWGHPTGPIGQAIVVTGVWDLLFKLVSPLVALVWLATETPVDGLLRQALWIAVALFAAGALLLFALFGHDKIAHVLATGVGRLVAMVPRAPADLASRLIAARADTVVLIRQRWLPLTVTTVAGHLNLAILLGVCLRGVGAEASTLGAAGIFTAFTIGRLVTAIPITPGGLGILEVGLIGTLDMVGEAADAQLVAAVLLLRALTLVVPIPLGLVSYLHWVRTDGRTAAPTGT